MESGGRVMTLINDKIEHLLLQGCVLEGHWRKPANRLGLGKRVTTSDYNILKTLKRHIQITIKSSKW